ncbi:glycosyltransferase [Azospirillum sp. YIM DDC1]|uniref:Glycosyltransferase n=1 Tax=Azospirillum aestuarii TaxID=2802052 RepID=A0ABS1I6V6_9PROT|nr:glycosyltransferase family 2 protein [Azospirillum aestuarii]MBK4722811.1 glycosyltransferase [Azospirillum aestuarii]
MNPVPPLGANDRPGRPDAQPPHVFDLQGWGGPLPFRLVLNDTTAIDALQRICDEEIVLIDEDIERDAIPFPSRIPRTRPRFTLSVLRHADPSAVLRRPAPSRRPAPPRAAWPWWRRLPILRGLLEGAPPSAGDAGHFAGLIHKAAGGKPVRIVGQGPVAEALQAALETLGAESVRLDPGYGTDAAWIEPGFLRRPQAGSFLEWFRMAVPDGLRATGLIVLLDLDAVPETLAVMRGLGGAVPGIVLPLAAAAEHPDMEPFGAGFGMIPPAASRHAPFPIKATEWPRISLVTVSYNQADFLEACLDSVLSQGYPNLDYVVIDGGSTDGSTDILERYRRHLSTLVIEPDEGQSDALNKGFARTTGDVLNWLCSDDLVEPGSFVRIAETFVEHAPDLVVGGCARIGETRDAELYRHHCALPFGGPTPLSGLDLMKFTRSWHRGHYFYQPEVFFSRRIWELSGGLLKQHLFYAMDYEMWLRMGLAGATAYHIPDMLACSRVHASQKTQSNKLYMHQLKQIMEEYRDMAVQVQHALEHRTAGQPA